MPRRKSLSVSIGICAYNEEQNIGGLLSALLKQRAKTVLIKEIIVVSSACTDNTDWIVKEYSKKYKRVKLVTQKVRKGKVSAMSLFIKKAKSNILVFENADTLPKEDAIELLVKPFFDKEIGMTGGRPIVVNDKKTFMGFTAHLLWDIHHQLALKGQKLTELVAFRKIFKEIPMKVNYDEGYLKYIIEKKGYKSRYVPQARFYLKGVTKVKDYIIQRKRCYTNQLNDLKKLPYSFPTQNKNAFEFIGMALKLSYNKKPKFIIWTFLAMILEFIARMIGTFDYYIRKESHPAWEPASSTKKLP